MKSYTAYLKHDNGRAYIRVWAYDLLSAKKQIIEVEKCPENSILFVGRTPTKKGIKQAKAWGY